MVDEVLRGTNTIIAITSEGDHAFYLKTNKMGLTYLTSPEYNGHIKSIKVSPSMRLYIYLHGLLESDTKDTKHIIVWDTPFTNKNIQLVNIKVDPELLEKEPSILCYSKEMALEYDLPIENAYNCEESQVYKKVRINYRKKPWQN